MGSTAICKQSPWIRQYICLICLNSAWMSFPCSHEHRVRFLVQLRSHCFCSECMVCEMSGVQAEKQSSEPSPVAVYPLGKYLVIIFSAKSSRCISRNWCLFLVLGLVGMIRWVQTHLSTWSLHLWINPCFPNFWLLIHLSLGFMCREAVATSEEQWIRREGSA